MLLPINDKMIVALWHAITTECKIMPPATIIQMLITIIARIIHIIIIIETITCITITIEATTTGEGIVVTPLVETVGPTCEAALAMIAVMMYEVVDINTNGEQHDQITEAVVVIEVLKDVITEIMGRINPINGNEPMVPSVVLNLMDTQTLAHLITTTTIVTTTITITVCQIQIQAMKETVQLSICMQTGDLINANNTNDRIIPNSDIFRRACT